MGNEDGGGGVGRRSDALAVTIARNTCRKTLKTLIQRPGPLLMRFMVWRLGQAVDGDLQMAPHLLENTRNRLGNGRPDAELDPGIRMSFPGSTSKRALSRYGLAAAKDIGVSREERNLPGLTP